MKKATQGQNHKFDKAYFGWVKFEINPQYSAINKELEKNTNILRFMTIATVRENTLYTQKTIFRPTSETSSEKPEELAKLKK
jgi:ribosomal protein S6